MFILQSQLQDNKKEPQKGSGVLQARIVLCVYHDGQKPSVAASVKGQKVHRIGAAAEHALPQSVCRMGFIRHFVGFLCPADKGLYIKFLIAFIISISPFNVSPLTSIKEAVFFAFQ